MFQEPQTHMPTLVPLYSYIDFHEIKNNNGDF